MSATRRAVRLFGHEYAVILPSIRDPRMHVAAVHPRVANAGEDDRAVRLFGREYAVILPSVRDRTGEPLGGWRSRLSNGREA